ncbi:glycosyltransferase family 4 protein [Glaciihabitans sp. INWT7]|uniref:glycosyltransferase n=1 Tax=Glaciihabitans sp. INWT7 TaxID=2596912 RepID=UPI0016234F2F|nr:glycosyltransferase [Glaciihabitans sp. INWT7]QNE47006.1 glycosyltransferase family 4 protein [Glaciihabitans sp. INWT7]
MLKTLSDTPHDAPQDAKAPLRVLIGADTFPPDVNGAANFGSRLAAGLTERGHTVHVEAPAFNRSTGAFLEKHDGAEFVVHRVYSWRWYPHDWLRFVLPWRSQAHAARILDEFKPDVVHIQSHIVVGRGLARQAAKRGIRVIGTNHFMPENLIDHTRLPQFARKWAIGAAWKDASTTFAYCEAVTSPSRKAADFLETETNLEHVHAISCGIDAALYTADFEPRTENRVIFVGRVSGEKHLDVLMKAIALIDPALDVQLEIVGGGDQMNQLKQLTRELDIDKRVTFTGYVTDEELRASLTHSTVFAMPSIAELQSIATMEAMASGLPVVAANAMALPHLVHEGENGYLFEPGNAKDLADKLSRVLRLPDAQLRTMKDASLRYIAAHDIRRTLNIFEQLYRGEKVTDPVTDASLDEQVS